MVIVVLSAAISPQPVIKSRLVFFDDFRGGISPAEWGVYAGQPSGDPGGFWAPSHVVVRDGILRLETYRDPAFGNRWVSGGLSSAPAVKQTFGTYQVCFRLQPGVGVAFVALLWPVGDGWPPEIDFAENAGGPRRSMIATLHYGAKNVQIERTVHADFTDWHVLGVRWEPGRLTYLLDGRAWATVSGAHVPAQPMELDLQTQTGTCGDRFNPCPNSTTPTEVDAEIGWVAVYSG